MSISISSSQFTTNTENVTEQTKSASGSSTSTTSQTNTVSTSKDGVDEGSGSDDGVDESDPDYVSELASAQSNQVVSSLINLVGNSLLSVTSIEALENEWARANSSDSRDGAGIDPTLDGQTQLDVSVRDNSQWWTENHGSFTFSALATAGNQNVSGLMPTPGGEFQLKHGYFQV